MASMVKQLKQSIRANRRAAKKAVKAVFDLLAMRPTFIASAMNGGLSYSQACAVERGTAPANIRVQAAAIRRQALLKLPVEIKRAA